MVAPNLQKVTLRGGQKMGCWVTEPLSGIVHDLGNERQHATADLLDGGAASSATSLLLGELKCIGLVDPLHFLQVRFVGDDTVHITDHIGLKMPIVVRMPRAGKRGTTVQELTMPDPWE